MPLGLDNKTFEKNQVRKDDPLRTLFVNLKPIMRVMRFQDRPLSTRVNDDRPSDQCSIEINQYTRYKTKACFPIKKTDYHSCLTRLRVFKAIRLRTVYRTKGSIISRRWRPVSSRKNAYRAFAECPIFKTFCENQTMRAEKE